MWTQFACDALRQKKLLELTFGGGAVQRFEVHAVGYSAVGRPIMRAWRRSGGGTADARGGWQFVRLDEATKAVILDEAFTAPRSGHKRNYRAFDRIICEL